MGWLPKLLAGGTFLLWLIIGAVALLTPLGPSRTEIIGLFGMVTPVMIAVVTMVGGIAVLDKRNRDDDDE